MIDGLKRYGRLTQIELAGITGLSPATVSNIVKELTAAGILNTSITSRSGRRATLVSLARRLGIVAGVHFSTRHLPIAIADATRTIVSQSTLPLPVAHRHDADLDRLTLLLSDMMDSIGGSLSDIPAIGLALPAPVHPRTGLMLAQGPRRGWEGMGGGDGLASRTGRAGVLDREARRRVLGEALAGLDPARSRTLDDELAVDDEVAARQGRFEGAHAGSRLDGGGGPRLEQAADTVELGGGAGDEVALAARGVRRPGSGTARRRPRTRPPPGRRPGTAWPRSPGSRTWCGPTTRPVTRATSDWRTRGEAGGGRRCPGSSRL